MTNPIKVLIIEDEPLTIEAYKRAFNEISLDIENLKFDIDSVTDCYNALIKLKSSSLKCYDIVFLDMRLPPSKDNSILCGEDLGVQIRSAFKKVKIIVATSYNDAFRISSILKNVNPDGFLIKGDLSLSLLIEAIKTVVFNSTYYS